MQKGTVKFFNETKGFGFIRDEQGNEIFVHTTGLQDNVKDNDNVVFDTELGAKGKSAINVRLS